MQELEMEKEIHGYDKEYEAQKRNVINSDLSEKNKELVLKFDALCYIQERLSKPRRIKLIGHIRRLSEYINKDFEETTISDLKHCLLQIEEQERLRLWTKQGYRVVMKKFFSWVAYG